MSLNVVRCKTPDEKRILISQLDPRTQSWVVSDLQSKWHLQKELLNKYGVLEKTSVVRALELWETLSFQVLPETHLLSSELAQTVFWNWIEPLKLPWAKSPHAVPVVLNQMKMWMSIFADPNHEDIMAEWFAENQEAYVRWGHWFELCSTIWKQCQERGLLMKEWLPALLLSQDLDRLAWKKELIFDLGPQISQVEGQLLLELGKRMDVTVLYPEAPWIGLMPSTLRPYEVLLGESDKGEAGWQPSLNGLTSFGRFSTQLAEVKDAVARIREWLEEGVNPQSIAVVAPDIEEYWPSLNLYFRQEGIPVAKTVCARMGGFVEMAKWLASLRTGMAKVSSGDLEILLFAGQTQPRATFDEFRVLFSNIYDAGDLNRAKTWFESHEPLDPRKAIRIAEFLAWTLKFWEPGAETERLLLVLQKIGVEVPRAMELLPNQWLSYLEGILARREMNLEAGDEEGIWCVSLSSADWLPATHAIFLNLNESALRSLEQSPVNNSEGQAIFNDTGYALGHTDRQEREFEFLWFLQRPWHALRLCFSGTDFQGRVLTPSRLWMWAGFISGQLKEKPESSKVTRWDELQRLPIAQLTQIRGFHAAHAGGLELGLKRDIDREVSSWAPFKEVRISASSLESYWSCPFTFSAQRLFKLTDDPVLDLDLDHRSRGSLLHAVLEELSQEPIRYEQTDLELAQLVERIKEQEGIRVGDERLWPAIRAQHAKLGRKFLNMEREWRKQFPKTETVGREVAFECQWDLDSGGPAKGSGSIRLAGRIDRVDRDSRGRYALIDYKASSAELTNWKTWMPKQRIQMALYALLIEQGLTELEQGEVTAANFYVVKDEDRRKGFHLRDESPELYATDGMRNLITHEEKVALYEELKKMTGETLNKILSGNLNPEPKDRSDCPQCTWRVLCRATHLN